MEISVVIPVYNEKNLIEQVLRELYEEVLSRFSNYEVIVINDASTDGTEKMLNKLVDCQILINLVLSSLNK